MSGTMGRMYIGASGLQAQQNAINTTAHNLTNLGTEGYSRQQVLMADLGYQNLGYTKVVF
ncbi:MAG: flagellar basal body protein, partial [Lachnospiraceae bacterium]|nr:flagellar basal body protein [Lachnospiraceae bacterium]